MSLKAIPNKFTVDSKTDLLKVKSSTVNTMSGNTTTIKKIKNRLNPDIETMEGAAVFRVCNDFNILVCRLDQYQIAQKEIKKIGI